MRRFNTGRIKAVGKGFTLIEILVSIVIVALLAAIALPSYQNSVQKTRRSDAQAALTQTATLQEQRFFQTNSYSADVNELGGAAGTLLSPEGYYSITAATANGGAEFTLTATALGPQLDDSNCRTLTLRHTGLKASTDSASAASTDCW